MRERVTSSSHEFEFFCKVRAEPLAPLNQVELLSTLSETKLRTGAHGLTKMLPLPNQVTAQP